jgi:hypothetical protein
LTGCNKPAMRKRGIMRVSKTEVKHRANGGHTVEHTPYRNVEDGPEVEVIRRVLRNNPRTTGAMLNAYRGMVDNTVTAAAAQLIWLRDMRAS